MPAFDRSLSLEARRQRGVTMLEVLVTLVIITLFVLASAAVQSSAVKLNKAAEFRTEAVLLATEMGERIEANVVEALNQSYSCNPCSLTTTPTSCVTGSCTTAQMAAFDLAEWGNRLGATLPGASATIVWTAANGATTPPTPPFYTITITWTDRRVNVAYSTTGTTETYQYVMTKTVFNPG